MIQAPAESAVLLDSIVGRICAELDPLRIFLFGSRARGEDTPDSDYDLMVELVHDSGEIHLYRLRMHELFARDHCRVDVHFRRPGEIERRKDDPGTVDWDVVREGRLLYSRVGLQAVQRGIAFRVREPNAGPPDSVNEWLEIAARDLYHARHHLTDELENWSDEICFLSQQAAEKMLKALIVSRRVRPRRTHDLSELVSALRSLGLNLRDLDLDCALLSEHAVEPRYPGTNRTRKEAAAAVAAAERIAAAVRAHLP